MFLKTRELGSYHPDQSHTASTVLKTDAVCESMTKSHVFIERYFSEENFHIPSNLQRMGYMAQEWFGNLHVGVQTRGPHKNCYFIRIGQNAFYKVYTTFMKAYFPGSRVKNMSTFLTEVAAIGFEVHIKKQRIRNATTRVVDCYWSEFKRLYSAKYKHEPEDWVINFPASRKKIIADITSNS